MLHNWCPQLPPLSQLDWQNALYSQFSLDYSNDNKCEANAGFPQNEKVDIILTVCFHDQYSYNT